MVIRFFSHPLVALVTALVLAGSTRFLNDPVVDLILWLLAAVVLGLAIGEWIGKRQPATNPRLARSEPQAPSPASAKLRAELAENLSAVKEFYEEFERIAGPHPPQQSDPDPIMLDLSKLASERLEDVPLRGYERVMVLLILREAIENPDALPFLGIQPGNSVTDVVPSGQKRIGAGGDELWQLPTKLKAFGAGMILSDQTHDTLVDLHDRLMRLRREVYNRYHPPSVPGVRT